MFRCRSCGKEVSFPSVLLNEDFDAKMVALCSRACQDVWYETICSANTPSNKPVAANDTTPSSDTRAPIGFNALGPVA
jgi:hypothetical protein